MTEIVEGLRVQYRAVPEVNVMKALAGRVRIVGSRDDWGNIEMLDEDGEVCDARDSDAMSPEQFWADFEPVPQPAAEELAKAKQTLQEDIDFDLRVNGELSAQHKSMQNVLDTLERVRLAGRAMVLKSVHGKTIIHDAGIMQDDAQRLAEAILGRSLDGNTETQEDFYVKAGFLSEGER